MKDTELLRQSNSEQNKQNVSLCFWQRVSEGGLVMQFSLNKDLEIKKGNISYLYGHSPLDK